MRSHTIVVEQIRPQLAQLVQRFLSIDDAHQHYTFSCSFLAPKNTDPTDFCIKNVNTGEFSPFLPGRENETIISALTISGNGGYLFYNTSDLSLVPGSQPLNCVGSCVGVRENRLTGERRYFTLLANGLSVRRGIGEQFAVNHDGTRIVFSTDLREFYPEAPSGLFGLAVWREETGVPEDISVTDNIIGAYGYSGLSIDRSGSQLLFRMYGDQTSPNTRAQKIVLRNLSTDQGHQIIRTLSGGFTSIGHCDWPFELFLLPREFNCPRLSTDGRTIVFSSQDGNLVLGDSNLGINSGIRDRNKLDVFIVKLDEPIAVPGVSISRPWFLFLLITFVGGIGVLSFRLRPP